LLAMAPNATSIIAAATPQIFALNIISPLLRVYFRFRLPDC
jgi:hypothetical protein